MITYQVPTSAPYYRGSGQAVAAIEGGRIVDATYSGIDVEDRDIKSLESKHPNAVIVPGMLSCYEFTPF